MCLKECVFKIKLILLLIFFATFAYKRLQNNKWMWINQAWAMVNFFNNGGIPIKFKKDPLPLPLIISKEKI